MSELYLIFFLIGAGLFLFVVIYSVLKKKQQQAKSDYLFADDEEEQLSSEAEEAAPTLHSEPDPVDIESDNTKDFESTVEPKTEPKTEKVSLKQQIKSRVARRVSEARVKDPVEPTLDNENGDVDLEQRAPLIDDSNTKPRIDPKTSTVITELVAKVKNPLPIEQHELLTLFRMHDYKFHRKVHIFGLNQLTENWRDIEFELSAARFVELGVSIQLADRDGAMTEKELHDFQQMVLAFSNAFDAPFEFSLEIDDAYDQGQILDKVGRRYDSMAVLNIVPKTVESFRTSDLESCARDLMMSSDKDGIFLKTIGRKDNISVLYRLACVDAAGNYGAAKHATGVTKDLVIYMNVPATKNPDKVFEEMVEDANSLATWLEGKVVDRNGQTITQHTYITLMQQIVDITNNMKADGMTPGDAVSKQLF